MNQYTVMAYDEYENLMFVEYTDNEDELPSIKYALRNTPGVHSVSSTYWNEDEVKNAQEEGFGIRERLLSDGDGEQRV